MPHRLKKILRAVLPIIVSIALLFWLFQSLNIKQIIEITVQIKLPYLFCAAGAMAVFFILGALRFVLLLRPRISLSLMDSVKLNFSMVISTHFLGTLSEALRVIYLTQNFNIKWKDALAVHISDRLLSVWMLCLALVVFAPLYFHDTLSLFLLGLIAIGLIISLFLSTQTFWPNWIASTMMFFASSLTGWRNILKQLSCIVASMIMTALALWIISYSMDIPMPYTLSLAIAPIAILASLVPFTYAGLGSREAALAYVFPLVSAVTKEQAFTISIALGASYFLSSLPGIFSLPKLIKISKS